MANFLTQFGITWTFDKALWTSAPDETHYQYGTFINGDYWVVGPVTIIGIDPPSVTPVAPDTRIKNGSTINPYPKFTGSTTYTGHGQGYSIADSAYNGYDNSMAGQGSGGGYTAAYNVALDVSAGNPLIIAAGSSLCSVISHPTAAMAFYQFQYAAVLTVLAAAPAANSFRPPYAGTDKTVKFTEADLNYSLLANLTAMAGQYTYAQVESWFERVWLDHRGSPANRQYHPDGNVDSNMYQASYSQDYARKVGEAILMLNTNRTNAQKRTLLIRMCQLGIDVYGVICCTNGRLNWQPEGGHCSGRKWPILFAGTILNDADMKAIGAKSGDYLYSNGCGPHQPGVTEPPEDHIYFGEDDQTFYVSQNDLAIADTTTVVGSTTMYGHHYGVSGGWEYLEYDSSHLGMPEWGIRHATNPWWDGLNWAPGSAVAHATAAYRECCTAAAWGGMVLGVLIMGLKEAWNHDALFDYMDRWMAITNNRQDSLFQKNMWLTYRANYGGIWTQFDASDPYSNGCIVVPPRYLSLNASVDQVEVADDAVFDLSGDFTFCWRMRGSILSEGYVIEKGKVVDFTLTGIYLSFAIGDSFKPNIFLSAQGSPLYLASQTILSGDTWCHMACVMDKTNRILRLYRDGVLDSLTAFSAQFGDLTNAGKLLIKSTTGDRVDMDDIRFYKKALSADSLARIARHPYGTRADDKEFKFVEQCSGWYMNCDDAAGAVTLAARKVVANGSGWYTCAALNGVITEVA